MKVGENQKMPHPPCGRSIKTYARGNHDAPSVTKYGSPVQLDAQIVARCPHCVRTALRAPPWHVASVWVFGLRFSVIVDQDHGACGSSCLLLVGCRDRGWWVSSRWQSARCGRRSHRGGGACWMGAMGRGSIGAGVSSSIPLAESTASSGWSLSECSGSWGRGGGALDGEVWRWWLVRAWVGLEGVPRPEVLDADELPGVCP